jgi:hypothetical protein
MHCASFLAHRAQAGKDLSQLSLDTRQRLQDFLRENGIVSDTLAKFVMLMDWHWMKTLRLRPGWLMSFGVQVGLQPIAKRIEIKSRSSSGSYSDFALLVSGWTKCHAMLKMVDL